MENNKNEEENKDRKEIIKNEKEDKKDEKEDKKENEKDKKFKKNKKNYSPIDNKKQDTNTFLENLNFFDKNRKDKKNEKIPNISNFAVNPINQIRNEDNITMNINENLIDPYPSLDTNPFRQNDYLNLAQNQKQINLLRIIADNLASNNQGWFSYLAILISYIIFFLLLTYYFYNHDGFMYGASISLYCMILSLYLVVSFIYLNEIKINKLNIINLLKLFNIN